MPANLYEYLINGSLHSPKNSKSKEDQEEHNKLSTLLSDLASVLEDKARLESDYCYLKLEYGSLIEEMERKTSNYQNEKACLMQHLEELEGEIKIKELKETRFKEKENIFNYEKKMYTTQIDHLKEEIQKEKSERNKLEKKLLEEMKFLHNELKGVLLDWLKSKDTCTKLHNQFTKHKTGRNSTINNRKRWTNLEETFTQYQKSKVDNKSSQTSPLSDEHIVKGLQNKLNKDSDILEELFFKRKPFEYL